MNGLRDAAASHGRVAQDGGRCDVASYVSADDGTRIFALRDPLRIGIVLAAATELACATLVHTSADSNGTREIPVSHGIVAASLLASAGQPTWRVPVLASASLHHLVSAGRLRRLVDVAGAAFLGALLREARRAERWEA